MERSGVHKNRAKIEDFRSCGVTELGSSDLHILNVANSSLVTMAVKLSQGQIMICASSCFKAVVGHLLVWFLLHFMFQTRVTGYLKMSPHTSYCYMC